MIRAVWIDASRLRIESVALPDDDARQLQALQRMVGGYIEAVYLRGGDMLFVDEDGIRHDTGCGFMFDGRSFTGSGVIVGRADPQLADARLTAHEITRRVVFWRATKEEQRA